MPLFVKFRGFRGGGFDSFECDLELGFADDDVAEVELFFFFELNQVADPTHDGFLTDCFEVAAGILFCPGGEVAKTSFGINFNFFKADLEKFLSFFESRKGDVDLISELFSRVVEGKRGRGPTEYSRQRGEKRRDWKRVHPSEQAIRF